MKPGTNQKKQKSGEQNYRKRKLLSNDMSPPNESNFLTYKTSDFFEKSPLAGAEKTAR